MNDYNAKEIMQGVVDALHLTPRAITLKCGLPYTRIYNILSGRAPLISNQVAEALKSTFNVNPIYLHTGMGEMFEIEHKPSSTTDDTANAFIRVIAEITEENKRLKARIAILEQELAKKA